MTTQLSKPKFYTFDQNNSGGYFIKNDEHGICETVIIEALSPADAMDKLNVIGSKVDGFHDFCSCCGERWSDYMDESDGEDVPSIYGTPVEFATQGMFRDKCFIHYMDGSIVEQILK